MRRTLTFSHAMTRVIIVTAGLVVLSGCKERSVSAAETDINQILKAISGYYAEYGVAPTGTNSEIAAILQGANPRGIVFFGWHKEPGRKEKNLADRWGTHYEFDPQTNKFRIISAGPNLQFADEDDLSYEINYEDSPRKP